MPKVSKESASQVDDHGIVEDRHEDVEGYTIQFLSFREDADGTPLMKGLPDDSCQSPHWGYVFKGKLTFRFPDHEEIFEAGDAFYLPAGHVPIVEAGSEYLQFSPSEELEAVRTQMMKNMEAMQSA